MIAKTELNELAQEWELSEQVVEKDYVIGWLLWGIGTDPLLNTHWAFKGGTCLKKCFIETYRFSEDLDFTVLPGGPYLPDELDSVVREVLERITEESGIDFSGRLPLIKQRGKWPSVEARIYYRGPRQARNVASVKLDLLANETVVRPTVLRNIAHPYSDSLPHEGSVRCYGFEEVFAEKLRALGERCRSRDLYDVVNLYWRRDLQVHPELIREVLHDKCGSKGVPVPTFQTIENSPQRAEVESEWKNMLAHQLPILPPFDHYWGALQALFDWLDGTGALPPLERIPGREAEDETWAPPPTIWSWGTGQPLEVIRFAAANHLCVELGYQGSKRTIEPYSLRRSRSGALLLHALRTDSHVHRSYRVDRIESIHVTNQPFQPVYLVEFSQVGDLYAPPITRRNRRSSSSQYVVECRICGKRFYRKKPGLALRKHNGYDGWPCIGRYGAYV